MKNFKKLSVLLLTLCMIAALAAPAAAIDDPVLVDPTLILSPETTLTVFVDGTESAALSDKYPFGETASIAAPTVAEKTFQYWTNAEGAVISYDANLTLTMYANTTVKAVYGSTTATAQTTAAFLNVTRTTGEIVFNATASAPSGSQISACGIRYSTTKSTLDALKGSDGVYVVAADTTATNWTLIVTPADEDTTYYTVVYATVDNDTIYSAVKAVKLSELQSGVSMVTDLGVDLSNIDPGLFCVVTFDANGGEGTMEPQGLVKNRATALNANTFTRDGGTFYGWNTKADYSGTFYADGASVTLSADTTLYAQWQAPSNGDNGSGYVGGGTSTYTPTVAETKNGKVTVDPKSTAAGAKVTVTVTPDEGYELDTLTVKDANGKDVAVTKNADGTYTYTQPAGKVTVTANFKAKAKNEGLTVDALLKMFDDLDPNGWYLDDVRYCVENGMMNGVGDGKFDPNGTTTRAMIVTILYRLEGEPVIRSGMPFSDVKESDWYAKAVSWAESKGIVNGFEDGTFRPNAPITREQLAAILYRYAQTKGQGFQGLWSFKLDFPDAGDVSDWATEAMSWMVMNGVINGMDGKLNPQGNATRVQVAAMVHRFCELIKK